MKVKTLRFGKIEVSKDDIVEFAVGLLGFEKFHRYVILNTDENSPFRWLQCIDDGDLAFVIIEPLSFMFEYDLEIPDADTTQLKLTDPEDVILYVIVSIPKNPKEMTANLQGPLVINAKTRQGRQIISGNPNHSIKVNILEQMELRAKKIQESQADPDSDEKGDKA